VLLTIVEATFARSGAVVLPWATLAVNVTLSSLICARSAFRSFFVASSSNFTISDSLRAYFLAAISYQ